MWLLGDGATEVLPSRCDALEYAKRGPGSLIAQPGLLSRPLCDGVFVGEEFFLVVCGVGRGFVVGVRELFFVVVVDVVVGVAGSDVFDFGGGGAGEPDGVEASVFEHVGEVAMTGEEQDLLTRVGEVHQSVDGGGGAAFVEVHE